ncbi:MAG TPA: metallophosphoesterase [Thermodesulfobacteriota bacterium]|nr:metallophosphoesterase [Thermodesulfobacteriota bacterium]
MPFILKIVLSVSIIFILVYSYVSSRIIGALRLITGWNRHYIKLAVLAIAVYILIYPLIALATYFSGSEHFSSAIREGNKFIDYVFMYPFWLGVIFVLQAGVLFLSLEIIRFLGSLIFKPEIIRLAHAWLVLVISAICLVYVPAKIYFDTKTVRTERVQVMIPNLPENLDGFKIAHISDLQADNRTVRPRMENYINAVNKLAPDIVVFTGDLVTYGEEHIDIGAEMMGRLKSRYGVYACLGDHDYWANPEIVMRSLREAGVIILENEDYTLDVKPEKSGLMGLDMATEDGSFTGSTNIHMTFVTNIYSKRPNKEILKTLATEDTDPTIKIFVTHQPSDGLVRFAAKNNYDIFLAGHTHGGQVVITLFGVKLTPVLFETSFLSGQYRFDSMFVNVNNGLGLTFSPVRYNSPATVTLIELKKGS